VVAKEDGHLASCLARLLLQLEKQIHAVRVRSLFRILTMAKDLACGALLALAVGASVAPDVC
jgi:hypothetical protein